METNGTVMPAYVSIPRKASLFRVVMERKLGIDWEHTQNSGNDEPDSIQTNQVQDGYAEL
jgi:hypothetical protein